MDISNLNMVNNNNIDLLIQKPGSTPGYGNYFFLFFRNQVRLLATEITSFYFYWHLNMIYGNYFFLFLLAIIWAFFFLRKCIWFFGDVIHFFFFVDYSVFF
jgi:hypothetical protein